MPTRNPTRLATKLGLMACLGGLLAIAICFFGVVKGYGRRAADQGAAKTQVSTDPTIAGLTADSATDVNAMAKYEQAVRRLLEREEFDRLDVIASAARTEKTRFAGGTWKLFVLYRGLRQPAEGLKAPENEWDRQLVKLAAWAEQKPASVTARVALADALFRYAEKERVKADLAREPGSEQLKEDPWAVIQSRLHAAELALKEASELPTQCPHWYFVKQEMGGHPDQKLLEQALAFEPGYYPFYRMQAMLLLVAGTGDFLTAEPKFAEEVSSQAKGEDGEVIYYQIAAALNGSSETRQWPTVEFSWEKVQKGFEGLEKKYGTSVFLQNQFALLAVRAHKHASAAEQFLRIGQNWDEQTWGSREYFESSRTWSLAPPAIAPLWQVTASNQETADGRQFFDQVRHDLEPKMADKFRGCAEPMGQNFGPYFDIFIMLDGKGQIENVESWPSTKLGECFVPTLRHLTVSAPPRPSYWMRIPIGRP